MAVCAEAIVISERVEAHAWMLRCCSNFSCKRKLDSVHAIFGDGLVTCDSLLTSLGIQDSCLLLDDVHHLLSPECGTWYKHFGASRWNNYGELFRALVFESYSSEQYEAIKSKILALMESRSEPQSLCDYFHNTIHVGRKRFARYSVHATPCNEERLGSLIAEANHASYVARIGGGSWDDPATQVKDCIIRMQERSNKSARTRDQNRRQSAANSHIEQNKTLGLMLVILSKRGFKVCKEQHKKSAEYYCSTVLTGYDGEEVKEVTHRQQEAASQTPRRINGYKCSCRVFVACRVQCRHLFAFHNREFKLQLVDPKFVANPLSASPPNQEYVDVLSTWCATRNSYVGSLGDRLLCQPSSRPPTAGRPGMLMNNEDMYNEDHGDPSQPYPSQAYDDGNGDLTMSLSERPNNKSLQEEFIVDNTSLVPRRKRNVTFRDLTDLANSIANLAQSLPDEESRVKCLGAFVQMRDALSTSAGGRQTSGVRMIGFKASAEEFLGTFGPNAEYRREGVFTADDHCNSTFEMQRHNIGRVRQKRLTSLNERLVTGQHGGRHKRRTPMLNKLSQNLHLADVRNRPAQCSYCASCQHTVTRCSVMDRTAFVGKKNSSSWNQWYRTLGNQSHHEVQTPTVGFTFKLNRELQEDIPPPSQVVRHLSLRAVFFSSEAVEFMARPTSVYRSKNLQNMQIPLWKSNSSSEVETW